MTPASQTPYDPQNPFAKILRGELPAYKLFEDERVLAIMDIMPRADGHCLVLPKAPSRNLLDIDPDDLAAIHQASQRMGRAAMRAMKADGLTIQQFNETAGGQVVFHTHVHVIPRKNGEPLRPHTGEMADGEQLQSQANAIIAALE